MSRGCSFRDVTTLLCSDQLDGFECMCADMCPPRRTARPGIDLHLCFAVAVHVLSTLLDPNVGKLGDDSSSEFFLFQRQINVLPAILLFFNINLTVRWRTDPYPAARVYS